MRIICKKILDFLFEVSAPGRLIGQTETLLGAFPDAEAGPGSVTLDCDGENIVRSIEGRNFDVQVLLRPPHGSWHLKSACGQLVLAASARHHEMLHGSAVTCKNGAVLFVGGGAAGKTSLALEMHSRGFRLACEGHVPVERESGLVMPFPRSPELDLKESRHTESGHPAIAKTPRHPPSELFTDPVGISHLFFLDTPYPGKKEQCIHFFCRGGQAELLARKLKKNGLFAVKNIQNQDLATVSGNIPGGDGRRIEEVLSVAGASGVDILHFHCAPLVSPDFNACPEIVNTGKAAAILGIAANTFSGAPLHPAKSGGRIRLSAIDEWLSKASSFILTGGSVSQRAELVTSIIEEPAP